MDHPWLDFWNKTAETIGIALAFAFGSSTFLLWSANDKPTVKRGLSVIFAGLVVTAAATSFVHGYLGWSAFLAPVVGVIGGLIGLPLMFAITKGGKHIEDRADDITDAGLKHVPGIKLGDDK
jgi:hypothetical protein